MRVCDRAKQRHRGRGRDPATSTVHTSFSKALGVSSLISNFKSIPLSYRKQSTDQKNKKKEKVRVRTRGDVSAFAPAKHHSSTFSDRYQVTTSDVSRKSYSL